MPNNAYSCKKIRVHKPESFAQILITDLEELA